MVCGSTESRFTFALQMSLRRNADMHMRRKRHTTEVDHPFSRAGK